MQNHNIHMLKFLDNLPKQNVRSVSQDKYTWLPKPIYRLDQESQLHKRTNQQSTQVYNFER
jgi:hypothetical protein